MSFLTPESVATNDLRGLPQVRQADSSLSGHAPAKF